MRKRFAAVLCLATLSLAAMASGRLNVRNADWAIDGLERGQSLTASLGLSQQDALQPLRSHVGRSGLTHQRFQQTYNGIPVWGQQIVVSRKNGQLVRLHGTVIVDIQLKASLAPMMSAEDALGMMQDRQALGLSRPGSSVWQYSGERSELVIYDDGLNEAVLAYAVTYYAEDDLGKANPTRPTFIVDARSGSILLQYEGLTTADGVGPGGNTKTGQYYYGVDFPPFEVTQSGATCSMVNANVQTIDMNNGMSGGGIHSFNCYENTYRPANGAYCPLNDAHYMGGAVFDMYNDWYSTSPLGGILTMRVHYGVNYANAFWNGSSITFGDGDSTIFPPISMDVTGHEVSHGFTELNSGLIYSGQSGGINEAFSDIAGEAAEYYNELSNDWLVGADIFKATGALRYMYDPPLDGASIDSINNYYNGLDVHYSSGIFNKAFYLLATTAGWDTQKAFDCFVKANRDYWTASTDFYGGAQGVLDAASDLNYDTDAVVDAFEAVDIILSTCTPSGYDRTVQVTDQKTGTWKYYRIYVPAGVCALSVETYGGTGDADLYLKQGAKPTATNFDCRSQNIGNDESCNIIIANTGIWYIGIYSYSSHSGVSLHVTY